MSPEIATIFSPELAARFDRLVTLYPMRRSALIPMLLYAQDEIGYISEDVIREVAARIGITELDVRNVISYYSLMHTTPHGKYHVQVCTNISCMLRGGNELLAHCKKRLGVGHKETTPDKLFSHLAMSELNDKGEGTAWFEHVSDETYNAPPAAVS